MIETAMDAGFRRAAAFPLPRRRSSASIFPPLYLCKYYLFIVPAAGTVETVGNDNAFPPPEARRNWLPAPNR